PSSRRMRLLLTTLRAWSTRSTGVPSTASRAEPSSSTTMARPSSRRTRPSSMAWRNAASVAAGSATAAWLAAMRSPALPPAIAAAAARSSAWGGGEATARASARRQAVPSRPARPSRRIGPIGIPGAWRAASALLGHVLLLLVAGDVRAPRVGADRARRLPDHAELAVGLDLADEHRLVQVVVALVHLRDEARRRFESLARHRVDHLVHVRGAGLLDRLLPHVEPDVGRFHRVVGERLRCARQALRLGVVGPLGRERLVARVVERHEVVPGREMAHQRPGVHPAQLFLADREGDD